MGSGKSYIVGEQGPELFTPDRSGFIIPNGAKVRSSDGGPVRGITISAPFIVQGSIVNDTVDVVRGEIATFARELPRAIRNEIQEGQARGRYNG